MSHHTDYLLKFTYNLTFLCCLDSAKTVLLGIPWGFFFFYWINLKAEIPLGCNSIVLKFNVHGQQTRRSFIWQYQTHCSAFLASNRKVIGKAQTHSCILEHTTSIRLLFGDHLFQSKSPDFKHILIHHLANQMLHGMKTSGVPHIPRVWRSFQQTRWELCLRSFPVLTNQANFNWAKDPARFPGQQSH